jgi:hypothetical protein
MALDDALRAELLAMAADDVSVHEVVRGAADPERVAYRREVDARNAGRLWEILDDYETWPGRRLVGDDGARAAWIVAQHAIEDPGLQRRCLEMLEIAVDCGDADPVHYAYLLDRVRMADGKDQLYGSQFVLAGDGDDLEPWPIDDPEAVDQRRRRLGLPPLTEHASTMRARWRERDRR